MMRALQDLELQVAEFKHNVAAGRYREAAWGLLQLKKIAQDGRGAGGASAGGPSSAAGDVGAAGLGSMDAMLDWCGSSLAQQLREDCSTLMQVCGQACPVLQPRFGTPCAQPRRLTVRCRMQQPRHMQQPHGHPSYGIATRYEDGKGALPKAAHSEQPVSGVATVVCTLV